MPEAVINCKYDDKFCDYDSCVNDGLCYNTKDR